MRRGGNPQLPSDAMPMPVFLLPRFFLLRHLAGVSRRRSPRGGTAPCASSALLLAGKGADRVARSALAAGGGSSRRPPLAQGFALAFHPVRRLVRSPRRNRLLLSTAFSPPPDLQPQPRIPTPASDSVGLLAVLAVRERAEERGPSPFPSLLPCCCSVALHTRLPPSSLYRRERSSRFHRLLPDPLLRPRAGDPTLLAKRSSQSGGQPTSRERGERVAHALRSWALHSFALCVPARPSTLVNMRASRYTFAAFALVPLFAVPC